MNAVTDVTMQEIGVDSADPLITPIEPDLKSERVQEESVEEEAG